MNKETTATKAVLGGYLGYVVVWLLKGTLPAEMVVTMPTDALVPLIAGLFCYLVPARAQLGNLGAPAIALLFLAGCSAVSPSITVTEGPDGSKSTTVDFGRYALLDGMPGEGTQQHESTTLTGVGLGDTISVGIMSRDDTIQPVSTEPLHGVALGRQQTVTTAIGDSIVSDMASGAAYEEADDAGTVE